MKITHIAGQYESMSHYRLTSLEFLLEVYLQFSCLQSQKVWGRKAIKANKQDSVQFSCTHHILHLCILLPMKKSTRYCIMFGNTLIFDKIRGGISLMNDSSLYLQKCMYNCIRYLILSCEAKFQHLSAFASFVR